MITCEHKDHEALRINTNENDHLRIPVGDWGSPNVQYNGNQIPSAGIWELLGKAVQAGTKAPRDTLIYEARRAEIFRQDNTDMITWTLAPHPVDVPIGDNVYKREERQRVRPLCQEFGVIIAKADGTMDPEVVSEILAACETVGLYPVGFADERLYLTASPDRVFEALGTKDFLRIAVYLRRPGSSSVPLCFPVSAARFANSTNDGTVAVTDQVDAPMQGTFISDDKYDVRLIKGIVRPRLWDPDAETAEEEMFCEDAAFGKRAQGTGRFYSLGRVGRQRCRLALQTALFSAYNAAALINHDTERFHTQTVLNRLSPEAQAKVQAGVPPALLMQEMAPWDVYRQIEVEGIRSTVYGSYLVAGSQFKLLPDAAKALAKQCGVESHEELLGEYFIIHRDPALPDGTSFAYYRYAGALEWYSKVGPHNHGIVLNPGHPAWQEAGGDFDGDSAVVYRSTDYLKPRGAVARKSLRLSTKRKVTDIKAAIIAAADDTTTGLLGPTILGAMCLAERELDTDEVRTDAATVAQASVEAKKHVVDVEAVNVRFQGLMNLVREAEKQYDFVGRHINALNNASGASAKVAAWKEFMRAVELGVWEHGSFIERAMARRAKVLDALYQDTEFFRLQQRAALPQSLVDAARAQCSGEAKLAVQALAEQYRTEAAALGGIDNEAELQDEEVRETVKADIIDSLRTLRGKFELAAVTGYIDGVKLTPEEAQVALVGYAPARMAAQHVTSEVFKKLGAKTSTLITQIIGTNWVNGEYDIADIAAIPSYWKEFEAFALGLTKVNLTVIRLSPNSTKVLLSAERT